MNMDEAKKKEGFYRTMKTDNECPKCNSKMCHCIDTEFNMGFSDNDANMYEWQYCLKCDYYERLK